MQSLTLLLLFLVHMSLSLFLAVKLNIWVDEAYSLNTTGQGVGYALDQALHFEGQLPFYFVVLALWRQVNDSIFFARLFSVLCIVLALYVVHRLQQELFPEVQSSWVMAYLAINPYLLWAATEIRVYALTILMTALLVWLFYGGIWVAEPHRVKFWAYVGVSVLAAWTSYFLGFVFIAQAIAVLALRQYQPLRRYLLAMTVTAICAGPFLWFAFMESHAAVSAVGAASWSTNLRVLVSGFRSYTLNVERVPYPLSVFLSFSFVGCLVWLGLRYRRSAQQAHGMIWMTYGCTVLLYGAIAIVTQLQLSVRYLSVLYLLEVLAVFAVISLLPRRSRRQFLGFVVPIIFVFNLTSLGATYQPLAKQGDYARVAEYLMAHEQPEQPILVFNSEAVLPLAHYYAGVNQLVPLPTPPSLQQFNLNSFVLQDAAQVAAALAQVPGTHPTIWLVKAHTCGFGGVDFNCAALEKFASDAYEVETQQTFYIAEVRRLRQKQA